MAELWNSARKLLRATHTPLKPKPNAQKGKPPARAWPKYSAVASLQISHDEMSQLRTHRDVGQRKTKQMQTALRAVESVVGRGGSDFDLDNVAPFAEVDWGALGRITKTLVKIRERDLQDFRVAHAAIIKAYESQARKRPRGAPPRLTKSA